MRAICAALFHHIMKKRLNGILRGFSLAWWKIDWKTHAAHIIATCVYFFILRVRVALRDLNLLSSVAKSAY